MKILSVRITRRVEEQPDLTQQLGSYTNDDADWNICRCCGQYVALLHKNHPFGRRFPDNELKFFKPIAGDEKPGSENYKKFGKDDYKRMEAFNKDEWHQLGVSAEAVISLSTCSSLTQTITSEVMWGVESDSDADHMREVEKGQLKVLRMELGFIGFSNKDIDEAFEKLLKLTKACGREA